MKNSDRLIVEQSYGMALPKREHRTHTCTSKHGQILTHDGTFRRTGNVFRFFCFASFFSLLFSTYTGWQCSGVKPETYT